MAYAVPLHLRTTLRPGEHRATKSTTVLSTLLGSCVAACLYDPVSRVAGMNHFLLANRRYARSMPMNITEAGRYGIHAMELLINDMMSLGAQRSRLQAKVFGGGAILDESTYSHFLCVGEVNRRFIWEFLAVEGIRVVSEDLGGEFGRVIHFHTDTFQVFRKFIPKIQTLRIEKRELGLWKRQIEKPEEREGAIILF